MIIKRNNLIILMYLIISSIIIFFTNSLISFSISNILLILLMCLILKLDIKNPLLIFLSVFVLYQISFPILNKLNINVFEYSAINRNYYFYNWIATISFILFYGSIENVTYEKNKMTKNINKTLLYPIYITLVLISLFSSYYIIKNGFQSKYDILNSNNFLLIIGNISYTLLIVFPLYLIMSNNINIKSKIYIFIFNLILMLFGMFTFGERSYLFNYIIIILLYYFTQNKVKIRYAVLISFLFVLLLAFSSSLKMLFTSSRYINSSNNNSIIINFLNSDFASAGFNFNYLLNNNDEFLFNGKTYIYDFLSPLEDIIPISQFSSTKWYTNTYWSTRKTGLGFSIIGEGYINFGLFGIIFQMFLISRITKYIYKKSNIGYYTYIIYMGYISLLMYSCRQAIGNIISPLFKYHILLAFCIFIINKLIVSKRGAKL